MSKLLEDKKLAVFRDPSKTVLRGPERRSVVKRSKV